MIQGTEGEQEKKLEPIELVVTGVGVAPGIAIGPVYQYTRDVLDVEERELDDGHEEDEIRRLEASILRAERDLNKIILITREKLGDDSADIFEAQLLMLRDETVYPAVMEYIRTEKRNADFAVKAVMGKYRRMMESSGSEYLRERANDLLDVEDRIVRHLRQGSILSAIEDNTIVVAENLTAADVILFSRRGILGCALDFGGPTSHVSIMARALGVPAVVSLHGLLSGVDSGDTIILDGFRGKVIANPSAATLENYRTRQERYRRLLTQEKQLVPLPSETMDGHRIELKANLELKEEIKLLKEYGAEGIGLFRTEILFLIRGSTSISEEAQYKVYREIIEAVGQGTTTFRMFDLGGDKVLPMANREHNPFLGWRGIRVLLDRPELLKPQIRAILRAGVHGPIRLLVPMVMSLGELREFRTEVIDMRRKLQSEGVACAVKVPVGVMVEVPSVALQADLFAAEADFFSIGTNDLTQYTLAVDRGNDLVASRYDALHPAVLQLISEAVKAAHRHKIPVSLCGELAAIPRAVPILVGLGLDELSASPVYLPGIKRVIRAMNLTEGEALAEAALKMATPEEVHQLLDDWMEQHASGTLYIVERDRPLLDTA